MWSITVQFSLEQHRCLRRCKEAPFPVWATTSRRLSSDGEKVNKTFPRRPKWGRSNGRGRRPWSKHTRWRLSVCVWRRGEGRPHKSTLPRATWLASCLIRGLVAGLQRWWIRLVSAAECHRWRWVKLINGPSSPNTTGVQEMSGRGGRNTRWVLDITWHHRWWWQKKCKIQKLHWVSGDRIFYFYLSYFSIFGQKKPTSIIMYSSVNIL